MGTPLKSRPYWPKLLARVDQLLAQELTGGEITLALAEEFGLPRQSVQIAIRRGDIPSFLRETRHARKHGRAVT